MITLSIIATIAALCIVFGVAADLLCWLFDAAAVVLAVPLAIIGVIVCLALFSGAVLVVALPFVLLGVAIGAYLPRRSQWA